MITDLIAIMELVIVKTMVKMLLIMLMILLVAENLSEMQDLLDATSVEETLLAHVMLVEWEKA
jgi:hypothetical protein